jgi:CHAT domain-containing protein/tetratricopeptide (TPR) repeat protein
MFVVVLVGFGLQFSLANAQVPASRTTTQTVTAISLNNLAEKQKSMGRYAEAEPLYLRALALAEEEYGPNDASTGAILNNLAGLYRSMARYADAQPLYVRALAISEKADGPDHPSTAAILTGLAGLNKSRGHYADAEPLYLRALTISEKAKGSDHPSTGLIANNLAGLYESMGRYAEAQPLYVRALAISEKANGPDHPDTGNSLNNLAGLFESMGRYAEAKPLYIRALAISEKANGPDHPLTGTSLNNLAGLYIAMGRYAEAQPLYVRTLAIFEKANGPDHPSTGAILKNLAGLYSAMGRYAEAQPLYIRALAISEKANGPDHPSTGTRLNNLAELYRSMGRYADAQPLYVRALAISEKANGPDHPDTGTRLNNLAGLYESMGRYADAQPLYVRALAISEKANGRDHPLTGTNLNNLALLYRSMGRYADAQPLYVRALAISEKANGPDHPSTGISLNNLAELYRSMGRYADAQPLYVRALAISEKANGPDHPLTGNRLNNLALLYESMGRRTEALPLYIRALAISEEANGPDHPDTAIGLNNLASLYFAMNHPEQAEPLLLRAWRIASNAGNPELAWTAQGNLRQLYATSKPDLAIWYGKQAVNTLQQVRAGNTALDKDTQKSFLQKNEDTYKALADLLFAQGRLSEGQQVLAMLKEAEYKDFIQRSGAGDPLKTQADDTEQERPWSERYKAISGQLAAMGKEYEALVKKAKQDGGLSAAEQQRKDALDADLKIARQAYDSFMVDLQREFTQSTSADAAKLRQQAFGEKNLASLRALQGTLRDLSKLGNTSAVTIHYLMTDKRLWILLTTPTVQLTREAAISEADLNRKIGQYREAIARRDPRVKELGKALYDILIAPVADDLKQTQANTLMLSLDGSLRYLPMAALYDGEQYLAQRYRLALFTEAAKTNLKDKPQPTWSLAGYGLTQQIGQFDALTSVRGELTGILQDMKGSIKLDTDFTARAFKTGLEAEPPVIHLATHFVFKPGNETESFLLMGDGTHLSLKDIKDGYTFINTDLLTLSACETAMGGGKDANGREVESFGALAQNQGAKGVIATLWPVADQSTGQFMQLFYGFRQQNPGMTKAQAMQMAQQAFIEGKVPFSIEQVRRGARVAGAEQTQVKAVTTTDHPYYWAPFILMGNWL